MSSAVADPRSIGLKDKLRRVMHNRSDQTEGQKDQYRQQLALEVAAMESRTQPDTRGPPALRTVTFSLTLATYWDLSARTRICSLGLWLRRSRVRAPSVTLLVCRINGQDRAKTRMMALQGSLADSERKREHLVGSVNRCHDAEGDRYGYQHPHRSSRLVPHT